MCIIFDNGHHTWATSCFDVTFNEKGTHEKVNKQNWHLGGKSWFIIFSSSKSRSQEPFWSNVFKDTKRRKRNKTQFVIELWWRRWYLSITKRFAAKSQMNITCMLYVCNVGIIGLVMFGISSQTLEVFILFTATILIVSYTRLKLTNGINSWITISWHFLVFSVVVVVVVKKYFLLKIIFWCFYDTNKNFVFLSQTIFAFWIKNS